MDRAQSTTNTEVTLAIERIWTDSLASLRLLWHKLEVPLEYQEVFSSSCFHRICASSLVRIQEEITILKAIETRQNRSKESIEKRSEITG